MGHLKQHLKSLTSSSIWVLVLPAALLLFAADPSMARTMIEWTAFALVLAGLAVAISMIVFPQIKIDRLLDDVKGDARASAVVVASVVLFVGVLVLSLVIWAKS